MYRGRTDWGAEHSWRMPQQPEAGRDKERSSPGPPEGLSPANTLIMASWNQCWTSGLQSMREYIFVVLSQQICGNMLWQPQETNTMTCWIQAENWCCVPPSALLGSKYQEIYPHPGQGLSTPFLKLPSPFPVRSSAQEKNGVFILTTKRVGKARVQDLEFTVSDISQSHFFFFLQHWTSHVKVLVLAFLICKYIIIHPSVSETLKEIVSMNP